MWEGPPVRFACKREAQVAFQPQPFGHALGFEKIGEGEANHLAFRIGEAVQEIAERACLRPPDQGVRVAMCIHQRPKIAAIVGEACVDQQASEFVIAHAEDRVRLGMAATKADLPDRLA